jgi:hypothetical protein
LNVIQKKVKLKLIFFLKKKTKKKKPKKQKTKNLKLKKKKKNHPCGRERDGEEELERKRMCENIRHLKVGLDVQCNYLSILLARN